MTNPPNRLVEDARRRASPAPVQRYAYVPHTVRPVETEGGYMEPDADGEYVKWTDIEHLLPRVQPPVKDSIFGTRDGAFDQT